MDQTLRFCFLVVFVGVGMLLHVNASSSRNDFEYCERMVKKWAYSSIQQEIGQDKHVLKDLLFFLHIPRTGGRTYFHCFLRKLYPSSMECPRSYDKLRFDPNKTKCRLLVTHDDYSMMSKLPGERTSVVTILRDPVERVFSTYEFSIEVAARFLVHPNLTSATQMEGRLKSSKAKGVSTLDIWPWKYLVPWMRADLFARRDARFNKLLTEKEISDSYNVEEIAMPLHEYINHHVAEDIIHNGATFQVAGLTNNSFSAELHEVRHCVQEYRVLGKYVLQVAKKKLDNMLYVGLTEDHRESATMFANVVGAQVMSQLSLPNSSMVREDANTEDQRSFSESDPDNNESQSSMSNITEIASTESGGSIQATMTVGKLMDAYEGCISTLRKAQARRRTASLKRLAPINFSKEARGQVNEAVVQQIKSLNDLDVELYEYAKTIFAKQHEIGMHNSTMDKWGSTLRSRGSSNMWKPFSLLISAMFLLVFFVFLLVKVRRTKMKVKL